MKSILLLCLVALAACKPSTTKEYIVVFKDNLPEETMEYHRGQLSNVIVSNWTIGDDFHAFGAALTPEEFSQQSSHPNIKYVEENKPVWKTQTCNSQSRATWGLNRVSEKSLNLNGVYKYNTAGQGVTAYIVDTGILTTHVDFGGRAVWGGNWAGDGVNRDCDGHGTHVAGTVGSTTWGVAKKVTLVAVKVMDCNGEGNSFGILNGINFVTSNGRGKPSVANLSLGSPFTSSLNSAIASAVRSGITMVVAAGNEDQDACNTSPASEPSAITVGSTDWRDVRSSFSNWGSCLDIFGPGSDITSTWHTSNTATNTISGTSMASPHVAGVAALFLGQNPSWTPAQVRSGIVSTATSGIIRMSCSTSRCNTSPNTLLYKGC